ncbi:MAG TPA: cupin domain-containing protein [Longimicrobiales bacterium]|nr:cupin domain-containing protein [Longimicrobiales bacterium]
MTPIQRTLDEPMMIFDLEPQVRELRDDDSYRRTGRLGRTLARSGRMRLVLVALNSGIEVGTHQADSPMTLQLIQGRLEFRVGDVPHELRQGQLLFFGPGDAHDIRALEESALLLTLSAVGDDFGGRGADPARPAAGRG